MTIDDLKQLAAFLDSIEGSGYGGMADYEVARQIVRREFAATVHAEEKRLGLK